MTRKDYVRIADAIKDAVGSIERRGDTTVTQWKETVIEKITNALYEDNPRFNYHKFVDHIERG